MKEHSQNIKARTSLHPEETLIRTEAKKKNKSKIKSFGNNKS